MHIVGGIAALQFPINVRGTHLPEYSISSNNNNTTTKRKLYLILSHRRQLNIFGQC